MSYQDFYLSRLPNLRGTGEQRRGSCPFCEHKEDFSVNIETGQFKCFYSGCGVEGDTFDFLMKLENLSFPQAKEELAKYNICPLRDNPSPPRRESRKQRPPLPESQIRGYVKALSDKNIQFLKERRGISGEVIDRYRLGYNKARKRFTIPVMQGKRCVNIRLYSPDKEPKILPISSGRSTQLYPEDQLQNDEVWLCEGELDALCGISNGLNAVTVTGGAGSWKDRYTSLLKGKRINIAYDCDPGGKKGAGRVAQILSRVAQVKVIDLALGEGEDLTDWFVKYKKGKEELKKLAEDTSLYERKPLESKQKTKAETRTLIPDLIHLVRQDGIIKYLLKRGDRLSIEETFTLNDVTYKPKQDLPIKIPSEDILREPTEVNYSGLLGEVTEFIRAYLEMPSDNHYFLLVLWVFHTYLVEKFNTTPILYFYGVKETGKTRAGEVLGELAFRCERLTSPTEATLFRSASYFKTSLIIDEIKLWGEQGNQEVARLIKSRYKRGLMVSRVNLNKKGEDQVEYFDVFAPLVICTTESIPDTIESRCITFLMQKNARAEVEKLIDETWAGKLRNKLTIFRSNYLDWDLPEAEQIARRRLNEIMLPLYQILMLIAPERKEAFKMIIEEMQTAKADEEGLSLEAEIVEEIINYQKETGEGVFLTKEITERLNKDRSERERITNTLAGIRIRRLGFEKTRLGSKRGFRICSELLKKLALQFGLDL